MANVPARLRNEGAPIAPRMSAKTGNTVRRATHQGSLKRVIRQAGSKYIIQCSYCGKQFHRKTNTTRLNKHTDRYGNQCYGRTGYFVRYG